MACRPSALHILFLVLQVSHSCALDVVGPDQNSITSLQTDRWLHQEGFESSNVPKIFIDSLKKRIMSLKDKMSGPHTFANKHYPIPLSRTDWSGTTFLHVTALVLICLFAAFLVGSMSDLYHFIKKYTASDELNAKPFTETQQVRSFAAVVGINIYRFYSGLMSASWLPYLIAMEGQDMWEGHQSLFMGIAKLIFSVVICFNPVFGLLGDRATMVSHGLGRRLFIRAGILLSGVGIAMCLVPRGNFFVFFTGIVIWRVGDGLNDVTTEALCPELLASQQFQFGSVVKSALFLLGGLVSYGLLLLFADVDYNWLYYCYLSLMLVTTIPALLILRQEEPSRRSTKDSFRTSLFKAYVSPTQIEGGFPLACLACLIFSCGSAPMFFILLMIRDVVGIEEARTLQFHFSIISTLFFIAAGSAAVCTGWTNHDVEPLADPQTAETRSLQSRVHHTGISVILFSAVLLALPILQFIEYEMGSSHIHIVCFYIFATLLGGAFGAVYARFQDCLWHLLPKDAPIGNAIGFCMMCRLVGTGVGNFVAGIVLDFFWEGDTDNWSYSPQGYSVVCVASAFAAIMAAIQTRRISSVILRERGGERVAVDER